MPASTQHLAGRVSAPGCQWRGLTGPGYRLGAGAGWPLLRPQGSGGSLPKGLGDLGSPFAAPPPIPRPARLVGHPPVLHGHAAALRRGHHGAGPGVHARDGHPPAGDGLRAHRLLHRQVHAAGEPAGPPVGPAEEGDGGCLSRDSIPGPSFSRASEALGPQARPLPIGMSLSDGAAPRFPGGGGSGAGEKAEAGKALVPGRSGLAVPLPRSVGASSRWRAVAESPTWSGPDLRPPTSPPQALPPSGIHIFASQLHTHLTGRKVVTVLARDGREKAIVNRDNHYSPHFQVGDPHHPHPA